MKQWSIHALDFEQVRQMIEEQATSELGKQQIGDILPSPDFVEVQSRLQQTQEAMDILRLKGGIPLGGVRFINPALRRAAAFGTLSGEELLDIASTIRAGRKARDFVRKLDPEAIPVPHLRGIMEQIAGQRDLQQQLDDCIDEQGEVKDQASLELKKVRRQIQTLRERIQNTLNQLLHQPNTQKMLQEPIITQRHQRYVMPVKQEYRHQFKGIVHDQSSSGATVFIEPESVVSINNELLEKEATERREVEKVLEQLTQAVSAEVPQLEQNVQALAAVDVMMAKAHFARLHKAACPKLSDQQHIRLNKARHPLLPADVAVPIDVQLGKTHQSIIITGPNTGGKTVTIKTIGLLALMTQSGFAIPAEDESIMPVYSGVFADIGDEQSIEQSLSTFSGHITHINQILQAADDKSLILLDELGAGTDPTEGAALAIAILEYILNIGAAVVATTHYSELKLFAHSHPQTVNASVEFDVVTLKPTYRLMIGVPGRSNAFTIAEKLGLPSAITKQARAGLSEESRHLEEMIASLADDKREAAKLRESSAEFTQAAQELHRELQEKIASWDSEKQRLKEKSRQEAQEIVREAKREADAILQEMREWSKNQPGAMKEHVGIAAKKRLEGLIPEESTDAVANLATDQIQLQNNDEVIVLPYNQTGSIVNQIDEDHYMVQVGQLKLKVERNQLQKKQQSKKKAKVQTHTMVKRSTVNVRSEIDVRGYLAEEAINEIDQYLDRAVLSGYKQVSIIHGKGTGALRSAIQQFLRRHRLAKSFRLGSFGEGGSGVTVVQFD